MLKRSDEFDILIAIFYIYSSTMVNKKKEDIIVVNFYQRLDQWSKFGFQIVGLVGWVDILTIGKGFAP